MLTPNSARFRRTGGRVNRDTLAAILTPMIENDHDTIIGRMFRREQDVKQKLACLRAQADEHAERLEEAASLMRDLSDEDLLIKALYDLSPDIPTHADLKAVCDDIADTRNTLNSLRKRKEELGF